MRKILCATGCLLIVAASSWFLKSQVVNSQVSDQISESKEERRVKELALRSELIITGQSINSESRWIEDGRVLVTLVTVSVSEVVKGEAGPSVTVALPGGIDANRRFPVQMTYPGAPTISPQEEVFLFLNETDAVPGGFAIAGFNEGKFSIVQDGAGNKLVSSDHIRTAVQPGPGIVRGNRQFVPASVFKKKIRGYLGQ